MFCYCHNNVIHPWNTDSIEWEQWYKLELNQQSDVDKF